MHSKRILPFYHVLSEQSMQIVAYSYSFWLPIGSLGSNQWFLS